MDDTYLNYKQLSANEIKGKDYDIYTINNFSQTFIIALHGGGIEIGTSEATNAIARRSSSNMYIFEGLKSSGNSVLHITSTNFDEPTALNLVGLSSRTISLHGASGATPKVYIGGLDTNLINHLKNAFMRWSIKVGNASEEINGDNPNNIINRNKVSKGVQLELTRALRQSFFVNNDWSRPNRVNTTPIFWNFVNAVVEALDKTAL